MFIFTTPVLIRHLWQLKTVVFLHWCLICSVPLQGHICDACPNPAKRISAPKRLTVVVNKIYFVHYSLNPLFGAETRIAQTWQASKICL